MNDSTDGFLDLGREPMPLKEVPREDKEDKKYYPSMHFDGKLNLPEEGEAHIRFRKHETTTRKDKNGEHHSHSFEVTAIKSLNKKPKSSSKGLSDTLDELQDKKIQKAQAKEINAEETNEED